ncbi:MAG: CoA transferase [Chloroflexi bacterium]|nr:CoA transferase [Chloroflexota bacterium]MYD46947.1 CoA transferase [Chloroflexota bacterium]
MPGPLHGINVVEFSTMIATPTAGMLLADMGASVIKVEPPWGDLWRYAQAVLPTEGRPFMAYNRGKRSMTLDLTKLDAATVVRRLTQQADVILANNRPDVAGRLGIDYETLAAVNPSIIYCEGSAFGHDGPDAYRPGYDIIIQAMSGIATAEGKVANGVPEQIVASPLVDSACGLAQAWAVCGALFARERNLDPVTGKPASGDNRRGQKLEASLLGASLFMLGMRFVRIDDLDLEPHRQIRESVDAMRAAGTPYPDLLEVYQAQHFQSPGNIYYRFYQTADGMIVVGCLNAALRLKLLDVIGLHDIRFDEGYDQYSLEAADFGAQLMTDAEAIFRSKTNDEWLALLDTAGVPAGPVRFVEELFDHPQVMQNHLAVDVQHRDLGTVRMAGPLASFSDTPLHAGDLPALGQHTDEVLAGLGYPPATIARLRRDSVV